MTDVVMVLAKMAEVIVVEAMMAEVIVVWAMMAEVVVVHRGYDGRGLVVQVMMAKFVVV